MVKIKWIHIISDLYECDFDYFLNNHDNNYIKKIFEEKIIENKLTVIWSLLHTFENNSFSLNIMLSESHICIHTWPEDKYVSIDIFVCNYNNNNTEKAKNLYKDIIIYFSSKNEKLQIIER